MATDLDEEKSTETDSDQNSLNASAGQVKPVVLIVGGDGKDAFGQFVRVTSIEAEGAGQDSLNVVVGSRVRIFGKGLKVFDAITVRTEDKKSQKIEEVFSADNVINFVIPSVFAKVFKKDEYLWLELSQSQNPQNKIRLSRYLVYGSTAQEEKEAKQQSSQSREDASLAAGGGISAGAAGMGKLAESVLGDIGKGVSGQFNLEAEKKQQPLQAPAGSASDSGLGAKIKIGANPDLDADFGDQTDSESEISSTVNLGQRAENQENIQAGASINVSQSGTVNAQTAQTISASGTANIPSSGNIQPSGSGQVKSDISGQAKVSAQTQTQTAFNSQGGTSDISANIPRVNVQAEETVQTQARQNISGQVRSQTAGSTLRQAEGVINQETETKQEQGVKAQATAGVLASQNEPQAKTEGAASISAESSIDSLTPTQVKAETEEDIKVKTSLPQKLPGKEQEPALKDSSTVSLAGGFSSVGSTAIAGGIPKSSVLAEAKLPQNQSLPKEPEEKKNESEKEPKTDTDKEKQAGKNKHDGRIAEELDERKNIAGIERGNLDAIAAGNNLPGLSNKLRNAPKEKKNLGEAEVDNDLRGEFKPGFLEAEAEIKPVNEKARENFQDIKNKLSANDQALKNPAKAQKSFLGGAGVSPVLKKPLQPKTLDKNRPLALDRQKPEESEAESKPERQPKKQEKFEQEEPQDSGNRPRISDRNLLEDDRSTDELMQGALGGNLAPNRAVLPTVRRILGKKEDLAKKGLGQATSKVWGYGFAISLSTFFSGFDFFVGALIMDAYWIFGHRKDPKLFPLSFWQKILTVFANLMPFVYAFLLVFLVLLAGCNSNAVIKGVIIKATGGDAGDVLTGSGVCAYLDMKNIKSYVSNQVETISPGGLLSTGSWVSAINASVQKFPNVPGCMLRVVIQKESAGQPDVIGCDCAYNGQPQYCPNNKQSNKYFPGFPFDWDHCSYGIGLTQWTIFQRRYASSLTDFRRWQSPSFPSRTPFGTNFYGVSDFLNPQLSLDLTAEKFSRDLTKNPGDIAGAFAAYVGASSSQNQFVAERMALYNMCVSNGG